MNINVDTETQHLVANGIGKTVNFCYSEFPSCCGMLIIHDLSVIGEFTKEELFEIVDKLREESRREDFSFDQSHYNSIMFNDIEGNFVTQFSKLFTKINEVTNEKTGNTIFTYIYNFE